MKLSNSEIETFIMYITKRSFINNNDHFSKASFPYTRFLPAQLEPCAAQGKSCSARCRAASRVHGNTLMATHMSENSAVATRG